jgi:hypothetical protein
MPAAPAPAEPAISVVFCEVVLRPSPTALLVSAPVLTVLPREPAVGRAM